MVILWTLSLSKYVPSPPLFNGFTQIRSDGVKAVHVRATVEVGWCVNDDRCSNEGNPH
jgi:hypothetical protein